METALRDVLGNRVQWTRPRGGFFRWAEFRDGVDDRVLFEHAVNARVSFVIGSAFFVNGEGHQYARLSLSAPSAERIHEGVARLRCALDAALTDSSSIHAKSATQPSQEGV
jgi:DNA-binding transcriptional MocR family regulator